MVRFLVAAGYRSRICTGNVLVDFVPDGTVLPD